MMAATHKTDTETLCHTAEMKQHLNYGVSLESVTRDWGTSLGVRRGTEWEQTGGGVPA